MNRDVTLCCESHYKKTTTEQLYNYNARTREGEEEDTSSQRHTDTHTKQTSHERRAHAPEAHTHQTTRNAARQRGTIEGSTRAHARAPYIGT